MSDEQTLESLEERIPVFIKLLNEPPKERKTGETIKEEIGRIETWKSCNSGGSNSREALQESWVHEGWKEVDVMEKDFFVSKAMHSELVKIGKPAIPYFIERLNSEYGDYPNKEFRYVSSSQILETLREIGDRDTSKELIIPFENRIAIFENLVNEEAARDRSIDRGYFEEREFDNEIGYYHGQMNLISEFWTSHPIKDVVEPLEKALKVVKGSYDYDDGRESFVRTLGTIAISDFADESTRRNCVDIMLDSSLSNFNWDLEWIYYPTKSRLVPGVQTGGVKCAIELLRKGGGQLGGYIYQIHRKAGKGNLKEMTSQILGYRKPLFWFGNLFTQSA